MLEVQPTQLARLASANCGAIVRRSRFSGMLVRWRAIDARRSVEVREAGLLKEGEQISFVISRMHERAAFRPT
ncbi:hypothetical protein ACRQ5Q_10140 [Bradyrhizobium sp. PMVTL-01]|uniref:hypothetical protein n=1 Tax=Bradyrhizobium sp. PMVTL-01 TaxID=3434999 RepID=UPI003F6F3BA3